MVAAGTSTGESDFWQRFARDIWQRERRGLHALEDRFSDLSGRAIFHLARRRLENPLS